MNKTSDLLKITQSIEEAVRKLVLKPILSRE